MRELCFLLTFILLPLPLAYAQFDYPTANLSTTWINNDISLQHSVSFSDGSYVRSILLRSPTYGTRYSFGFFCTGPSSFLPCARNTYLLAVFIVQTNSGGHITMPSSGFPHAVWYANRDRPVRENATLTFTSLGDLSLSDADGTLVWSTNTSGMGIHALSLQSTGNLVLADAQNGSVWQSFDHPVDILVLGQTLRSGIRLIASTYLDNSTQGSYYMQMDETGLTLYVDDPVTLQPYWSAKPNVAPSKTIDIPYVVYRNGTLDLFISNLTNPDLSVIIPSTPPQSLSYLQLGVDGKIRVYSWVTDYANWTMLVDLQSGSEKTCSIPTICGPYGICNSGQCSCLRAASVTGSQPSDTFSPIVSTIPSLGCTSQPRPVCNALSAPADHFLRLDNYYYPNIVFLPDFNFNGSVSVEGCQQRCLQNCSCMAAFFQRWQENDTLGTCLPVSKLYTITPNEQETIHWKSAVLIRMQSIVTSPPPIPPPNTPFIPPPQALTPQESPSRTGVNLALILSAVLGSAIFVCLLSLGSIFVYRRRRERREEMEDEEDMFEAVPGLIPARFSFRELKVATGNFSKILGAGGFGSVFLGVLLDGSEVAVKRLESASQGRKEFRTEVCIIGSIHHVNLVRLRGFCAEKKHRLLVYEYMPKGSLEKWLFPRTNNPGTNSNNGDDVGNNSVLDWELRFNIALGTARGLAYLHEECSKRIIHLDIKPPNILLDDNFVAKVSDFGLSKLMSREESRVVTTMRGTPGYLAPEWLHADVTEKADVYSFGIMLFEIASGRKSVDMSVESELRHIPVWASRKIEEGRLMDVIDAQLFEAFNHKQAETMVKVALWCIQENPTKRPSMGSVVQMLEGMVECPNPPLNVSHLVDTINHYRNIAFANTDSDNSESAMDSVPLASVLSGSR